MNSRLLRALTSNISSAILALFLALVVWVVAVYEKAPPRTAFFPTGIPIQVISLGQGLIISSPVAQECKVKLRALDSTWQQLVAEDFQATADLNQLQAGQHEVPIVITTLNPDIVLLGSDPAQVPITLEETDSRKVRVRVKVLDEENIPLGYTSHLPVVTPEQITISGPKTLVAQVTDAVVEVSLRNVRETVVKQETPLLQDSAGNRVQGLTLSPATVTVTVVIERQVGYRDVTVRAVTEGAPAAGYWISNISVEPALVTVYGQQSVIEGLPGYLDTQPIDVKDATRDVIKRIALALPEGVLVLGEGAGKEGIVVQVSIEPLLGGQTVRRDLEIQNLRSGLHATPLLTSVDIILYGPLPALQELKPEDVHAILNLFGLPSGTHKVTPQVILPEGLGLEVKSIVPDVIEVTIE